MDNCYGIITICIRHHGSQRVVLKFKVFYFKNFIYLMVKLQAGLKALVHFISMIVFAQTGMETVA